ncbi:6-pyruvoyl trahydropterin synthase family protein [Burkholderia anthina]|uniref:6-carboxy-5,6,7,8-tetrahydropterin synthase n=1 Tax=Burkholderia anthina TaxID=179879 RepID=A0A6P2GGE9_9BURK|nr:6-carboxytetrahydropterin synthase [Burkholderia anthina]MBM2770597.1 6-carboxytetrahydropterin synthase [Burkholderia anthina]VVU52856.1 6-carboxy-5,6,7,8-tetrahydropterin synthase [Burkholderia anthina]
MLIRKLFRFENAHIVRGCSTRRCSHSIHGHSYKVELLLEAHALDNGQMVYDFGLLKGDVRDLIDAFDHAVTLWSGDDRDYVDSMRRHSERWVLLPVSPSAEQFSRVLFRLVDAVLSGTAMSNGEADVHLHSVIVHETETGYAQCFRDDAFNPRMGRIDLDAIVFSPAIAAQWRDPGLFDRLARDRVPSMQESR